MSTFNYNAFADYRLSIRFLCYQEGQKRLGKRLGPAIVQFCSGVPLSP
jgi:hypothetical protein